MYNGSMFNVISQGVTYARNVRGRLVFRDEPIGLAPWTDVDWTPWCETFEELVAWIVQTPALARNSIGHRVVLELESGGRYQLIDEQSRALRQAVREIFNK